MRQVGQLVSERDAQRFAAWLVTQEIEAHAERENGAWSIWVRNEDQLPQAKAGFDHFQANPGDARYADAEKLADAARRQAEAKREQARRNTIQMRDRWGTPGATQPRKSPVVLLTIGICVLVFLVTDQGKNPRNSFFQMLRFSSPVTADLDRMRPITEAEASDPEAALIARLTWASISRGEVWRLVTPIFLHFSYAHVIFNMYWLYMIGGPIENRYGSRSMLLLMLLLAVTSNVGQALATGYGFGGMSGVGYGVFGFAWMRSKYDPASGIRLDPGTVFIGLLWFVLCILSAVPPFSSALGTMIPRVANVAHAVGLIVGVAVGYPWYLRFGRADKGAP